MHKPTQKDELLKRLSILDFMLVDLCLYLNVNPQDVNALAIHAQVAEDALKLRGSYEENFGPLTSHAASANGKQWSWIRDPWPWEAEANFEI